MVSKNFFFTKKNYKKYNECKLNVIIRCNIKNVVHSCAIIQSIKIT